jgi:hypothetical protein
MFVYKIWIYVVRNLYKIVSCFLKIIKKRYFSNSFYHYSCSFQLNLFILVQTVDMNRLIFQNSSFLKTICNATRFHRSLMIECITTDQILTLSEIARKVIRRRVHISNSLKEKLTPYKRWVRYLAHTQLDTVRKNEYYALFPTC